MYKIGLIFLALWCVGGCERKDSDKKISHSALKDFKIPIKEISNPFNLVLWGIKNKDLPVVSVAFCFKNAGSKKDPEKKQGLTLLMSRLFDEGAGPFNGQKFKEHLLLHNIQFTTYYNEDNYYFFFRTIKENLSEIFKLFKLITQQTHFSAHSLSIARNQTLIALQQGLEDEDEVAFEFMKKTIFPQNHPYSRTPSDAIEGISHVSPEDLKDFTKENFTLGNLSIAVVGNYEESELFTSLDQTLTFFPKNSTLSQTISYVMPQLDGKVHFKSFDIPQTKILFTHPNVNRHDKDFYPLYLVTKVLIGNAMYSRLWQEVREKRGLAYDIRGDLVWQNHTHYFLGECATESKNTDQVITIIKEEWIKLAKNGITEEELNFAKKQLIDSYAGSFADTMQISRLLMSYQNDQLPASYPNKRNSYLQAVTLEEANQVIKKHVKEGKLTFFVVGREQTKAQPVHPGSKENISEKKK